MESGRSDGKINNIGKLIAIRPPSSLLILWIENMPVILLNPLRLFAHDGERLVHAALLHSGVAERSTGMVLRSGSCPASLKQTNSFLPPGRSGNWRSLYCP